MTTADQQPDQAGQIDPFHLEEKFYKWINQFFVEEEQPLPLTEIDDGGGSYHLEDSNGNVRAFYSEQTHQAFKEYADKHP